MSLGGWICWAVCVASLMVTDWMSQRRMNRIEERLERIGAWMREQ